MLRSVPSVSQSSFVTPNVTSRSGAGPGASFISCICHLPEKAFIHAHCSFCSHYTILRSGFLCLSCLSRWSSRQYRGKLRHRAVTPGVSTRDCLLAGGVTGQQPAPGEVVAWLYCNQRTTYHKPAMRGAGGTNDGSIANQSHTSVAAASLPRNGA